MPRARLRDLGIVTGTLPPGQWNAITDVAGVRVGYTTLIHELPHRAHRRHRDLAARGGVDRCRVRRHPLVQRQWRDDRLGVDCRAGDAGLADLYHQHAFGRRRARCGLASRCARRCRCPGCCRSWPKPMTAGSAMRRASRSPRSMRSPHSMARSGADRRGQCRRRHRHDLPRVQGRHRHRIARRAMAATSFTVGALVQANYGARELLRVDGVPVGREIGPDVVPSHRERRARRVRSSWCWRPMRRCCRSSASGWHDAPRRAWPGSAASAPTAAANLPGIRHRQPCPPGRGDQRAAMLSPDAMTPLFQAAAEATEEAMLNALTAAETMTGFAGHIAHALPFDRLVEVMRRSLMTPPDLSPRLISVRFLKWPASYRPRHGDTLPAGCALQVDFSGRPGATPHGRGAQKLIGEAGVTYLMTSRRMSKADASVVAVSPWWPRPRWSRRWPGCSRRRRCSH